jgi:hypothetical protein
MPLILNKAKSLIPKTGKEIRYISHIEKKSIEMVKNIAKQFGEQSKKNKPKKMILR